MVALAGLGTYTAASTVSDGDGNSLLPQAADIPRHFLRRARSINGGRPVIRFAPALACFAVLALVWCSGAAMGRALPSDRERGRLDPYSADYRIVDEYRFRAATGGRSRDGETWSIPEKWEGLYEFPDDAGSKRIGGEAAHLGEVCGEAGGRYGDKGFLSLQPTYLLMLVRKGRAGATRALLRGRTAYEGAESMEPGTFTCMLDGGRVTLWIFDPE